MTGESARQAVPAAGGLAPRRHELRETLRLAAPIILTQLAWVGMLLTDTAMVGRLGAVKLAGATLGLSVFFFSYIFCTGVVMATAPLAAQAFGARQPRLVRRVVRQGLWVTVVLTAPIVAGLGFTSELLGLLGQPDETRPLAAAYMSSLMWSLPFAVGFVVLRNFVAALSRPAVALWVMLAGVPANALLDYALIFGAFGLPRLELVGAGLATMIVNVAMFGALVGIAIFRPPFARYAILARFWRPDWGQFGRIFQIGLPIAGSQMLEVGYFIAAVFVVGRFGSVVIAAHQIAMQLPFITFMVPMGLAQAATVRVGQSVGRQDAAGVYRAGWTALALALAFMSAMTVLILAVPESFASIFLDTGRPDAGPVLALAVSFLLYAAFFQLADGVQVVAMGALRGLNDTLIPMFIAGVSYWGVGAATGLTSAFAGGMQGAGMWLGFVAGLGTAAVLLALRFRRHARRRYMPEAAGA